jgi:hypothetical protein
MMRWNRFIGKYHSRSLWNGIWAGSIFNAQRFDSQKYSESLWALLNVLWNSVFVSDIPRNTVLCYRWTSISTFNLVLSPEHGRRDVIHWKSNNRRDDQNPAPNPSTVNFGFNHQQESQSQMRSVMSILERTGFDRCGLKMPVQDGKPERTISWIWLSFGTEQIWWSRMSVVSTIARFAQHPVLRTGMNIQSSSCGRKSCECDIRSISSLPRDKILCSSDEMIYIYEYSNMTQVWYNFRRMSALIPWWIRCALTAEKSVLSPPIRI